MKFELVFVPFPATGHLRSTVEISKLLTKQDDRLSITVLLLPSVPGGEIVSPDYITSLSSAASNNRLRYKIISDENTQPTTKLHIHIENQKPKVREIVEDFSKSPDSPRISGFVVDLFCTTMKEVADEFNIPSYLFYTSGAGLLGLGFHVQKLYDENRYNVHETDYEESDAVLDVPSLTIPYPVKCLPNGLASKDWLPILTNQARKYREMKGILVNTVSELESYALKYLNGGDSNIPPVYPVGPLLDFENQENKKSSDILEWLDEQPPKSVVFLCFGSMGGFSEEQAREIATAIEKSNHRFLWSLRRASPPGDFTNLEEILPKGFLNRTKTTGKVIGWAPQVAVLEKPAIGGFVTHCGWNSALESIWFNVPMAAWPLYSEQKFNAFEMVEELGLAVEIKKYWRISGKTEMVTAEEIEKAIKGLMTAESDVRKKMNEMSEKCHVAVTEGGSSQCALMNFIKNVISNI